MPRHFFLPDGLIAYGPDSNCTLSLCPVEASVIGYRPWRAASGTFIGLFAIAIIVHAILGLRWRTWTFSICIVLGCIDEIIGYVGRLMLYSNPFSFSGFLMEIICITTAPVFFCAAIYVTLSKTIVYLDPSLSRFDSRLVYWVFIPCDIVSLALQAGGGATSSTSTGSNKVGVDVSLGGLALQVFTLLVFVLLSADYLVRYFLSPRKQKLPISFYAFLLALATSSILIFIRCAYRIGELSEGYSGPLFTDEGLFTALESSLMALAAFVLALANPGIGLENKRAGEKDTVIS